MKKMILFTWICATLLSSSYLFGMWYAVNPQNPEECVSGSHKNNLIVKCAVAYALYDSNVDAHAERAEMESHIRRTVKKGDTYWHVTCPGCNSSVNSDKRTVAHLLHKLRLHWYARALHQPSLYNYTVSLLAESESEARRLYARKKECMVIPFSPNEEQDDEDEKESSSENERKRDRDKDEEIISVSTTKKAAIAPQREERIYIVEEMAQEGEYAVLFAPTREELLEAYLKSKAAQHELNNVQDVGAEVLQATRKQRLLQDTLSWLVCPAEKCMERKESPHGSAQEVPALEQSMLIHYLAHHKNDHREIAPIVACMASSYEDARANLIHKE